MSDNPDNGLAEDEEMTSHLLALLYPDEGDASAASESEYEDASELSDFRSLLGHFREMPEEEPPPAISNKLLAMAAQHAPAAPKTESKSLFERISDFLLPAVYHPGLASAATLVLVAGLGATLYVNGKSQVAEPVVATEAVAPQAEETVGVATLEEAMPTEAEPPAAVRAEDVPADTATALGGVEEREVAAGEGDLDLANEWEREFDAKKSKEAFDDSSKFKAEAKRDRSLDGLVGGAGKGGGGIGSSTGGDSNAEKAPKSRPAPKNKSARKSVDAESQLSSRRGTKNTKSKPKTTPGAGKGPAPKKPKPRKSPPLADESVAVDKSQPTPEPKPVQAPQADPAPPPPPPSAPNRAQNKSPEDPAGPAGDDDDAGDAVEEEPAKDKKPAESKVDPAAQAASLHKRAIAAAKKNQCSKVKSIGQQIRKLSSAYYDRTFLNDKQLTACLAPDVKKK